jgi:copper chaperone
MIKETIVVANLKCNGCANTVTNELGSLDGVNQVHVNLEEDSIEIDYLNETDRATIIQRLHKLGYPEATEENGLLMQLKSFKSCMTGRLTK